MIELCLIEIIPLLIFPHFGSELAVLEGLDVTCVVTIQALAIYPSKQDRPVNTRVVVNKP